MGTVFVYILFLSRIAFGVRVLRTGLRQFLQGGILALGSNNCCLNVFGLGLVFMDSPSFKYF